MRSEEMKTFTVVKTNLFVGKKTNETKEVFQQAGALCDQAVLTEDGAFYYLHSFAHRFQETDETSTLYLQKKAYNACDGCAHRLQHVTSGCPACSFERSTKWKEMASKFPKKKILALLEEQGWTMITPNEFYSDMFPRKKGGLVRKLDRRKFKGVAWDHNKFRLPVWLFDENGRLTDMDYGLGSMVSFSNEPNLLLSNYEWFQSTRATPPARETKIVEVMNEIFAHFAYDSKPADKQTFPIRLPYSYKQTPEGDTVIEYASIIRVNPLPLAFSAKDATVYRYKNALYQVNEKDLDTFLQEYEQHRLFNNSFSGYPPVSYLYDGNHLYRFFAEIKEVSFNVLRVEGKEVVSHSLVYGENRRQTYVDAKANLYDSSFHSEVVVVDEELYGDRPTLAKGDFVYVTHPSGDKRRLLNTKGIIEQIENEKVTVGFLNGYFHETFNEKELFKYSV